MPRLSKLSNRDLVACLHRLVADERARLVEILLHLNEVRRRKIHLREGFHSLFDYCVEKLGYSTSAAGRRIAAARVLRVAPGAGAMLAGGEVTLSTLSLVASLFTPDNEKALLARIRGKSHAEVSAMMATYRPERSTRDRVRPVCVRERVAPAVAAKTVANTTQAKPAPDVGSQSGETGKGAEAPADTPLDALLEPPPTRLVHKHEIRFIAGPDFMAMLERMRALHGKPGASCEALFAAAMEAYIHAHCPIERNRRRAARKEKARGKERKNERTEGRTAKGRTGRRKPPGDSQNGSVPASETGDLEPAPRPTSGVDDAASVLLPTSGAAGTSGPHRPSRHIPAAVRDRIYERDRGQCTFVGPGGRRCGARTELEVDHVVPFALGGTHDVSNLRLRCRAHNMLTAERAFGREKISWRAQRGRISSRQR